MADNGRAGGSWKPVRGMRASEEVVNQIREAFYNGLAPGDWLGTETELAERFGVSRITVRDAIRALEAQGIVDVKVGARGGLRVANGDPDRFAEALSIQLHLLGVTWGEITESMRAIEPVTAALAAQRATTEQVAHLRELVKESARATNDPRRFTELGLEFHLAVVEAAQNRALRAAVRALRDAQQRKFEPNTSRALAQRVAKLHGRIAEAIADGDADLASDLMTEHLLSVSRNPGRSASANDPCMPGARGGA